MPRFFFVLLLVAGLGGGPAAAQRVDVPLGAPPAGFAWQALPASKAAVLLPVGWYYRAEGGKDTHTYCLTREEMGETGEFDTGLSVQVVRNAKAQTRRPAAEYAELLMLRAGYGPGRQPLEKAASAEGSFRKWTVRYRESAPDAEARIVFQMALANTKTDTLYLLTFESAEADWPAAYKLGDVMVRELVLDSRR